MVRKELPWRKKCKKESSHMRTGHAQFRTTVKSCTWQKSSPMLYLGKRSFIWMATHSIIRTTIFWWCQLNNSKTCSKFLVRATFDGRVTEIGGIKGRGLASSSTRAKSVRLDTGGLTGCLRRYARLITASDAFLQHLDGVLLGGNMTGKERREKIEAGQRNRHYRYRSIRQTNSR